MTILRPIDSFRRYFLDVKPYHTKILEIIEKYNFHEDLPVNIEESIFFNIEYKNDPLCKTVGYGYTWDEECGFDPVDCCDLFDCIGGYGLVYDNSDLVVSLPINKLDDIVDAVSVPGNHTYDVRTQIDSIPSYDTIVVVGDITPHLAYQKLFLVVPVRTLTVNSNTSGTISIRGNYAAELINERKFRLYNTRDNDGIYNVLRAIYDSTTDVTEITLAASQQITTTLTAGIIEYKVGSKNNGGYLISGYAYDGSVTTITLHSTTYASYTNTTEGSNHGSIQLRTGMLPGRYIDIDTSTDSDKTYKIIRADYNGNANETIVHLASDVPTSATSGFIRMYGYINDGGFDGDGECSTPKHSNIKVGISEKIVFDVSAPPLPSPTPTPTHTVTPTVTPTQTAAPTVTPTLTVTPTQNPTATVTPTVTPTGTSAATPTPTVTVTATVTPTQTVTPTITPTLSPMPLPSMRAVRFYDNDTNYFFSPQGLINVDHKKMTLVFSFYGDSYTPGVYGESGSLFDGTNNCFEVGYVGYDSGYGGYGGWSLWHKNKNCTPGGSNDCTLRYKYEAYPGALTTGSWHSVMYALDSTQSKSELWVDGNKIIEWAVPYNTTFRRHAHYALAFIGINSETTEFGGGGAGGPNARLSYVWAHDDYYDPSIYFTSFFDGIYPKNIGYNGELAVGVQPLSYFPEGHAGVNQGLLNNWSENGTVEIVDGPNA